MFGTLLFANNLFASVGGEIVIDNFWADECPDASLFDDAAVDTDGWSNQLVASSEWVDDPISTITSRRCR